MKSVLIIGMGHMGRHLASKLQALGNEVMIVDKNPDVITALSDRFTDSNICDCTNESIIEALGVDNFDICFVTIGEDFQASLVVTSLLKQYGARMIVSKAKQKIQADLLRKIGADEIVWPEKEIAEIELMILQAARVRMSRTEYIACPSCGRTLYDIEGTLTAIRARTSHLKNLKIGVMGCIVNGPGEMADADYGYVGAAPGRITLYKGRTVVEKNIPQEEALDRLVALIKANGDWADPENQPERP